MHAQHVLSGQVVDNQGRQLPGASVLIHELQKGRIADGHGNFEFNNLKPGHYHLHVHYLGYEAQRIDVEITQNMQLRVLLNSSHLELREVLVENDLTRANEEQLTQSTDIVSEAQIRKYAGLTLMQSLERLPGIQTINTGIGISKPVIRGMSFNRVVVAENGIKQEGQQWGIDHGLELDQFNVGRIEVLKGPASLLYGSDAMAGVIQIKPRIFPAEDTVQGSITLLGRTVNDHIGTSAAVEGHRAYGLVYRMRLTAHSYGDYKLPADSFQYNRFVIPIPNAKLENTAGEELHLSGAIGINKKWGYSHINLSSFDQNIGFFPGAIGRPLGYRVVDDGNSRNIALPSQRIRHYKLSSNSSVILGKNWLELDLGYQLNRREELSAPHAHGRPLLDSSNTLAHGMDLSTWSYNARYHLKLDSVRTLILGGSGQYQTNRIDGFEFLIPDFDAWQAGAFALLQWQLRPNFFTNAGLRYDIGGIRSAAYRESLIIQGELIDRQRAPELDRFFHNFSGAVGMSWMASKSLNFKANLGSSFRLPTVAELSSNGVHHGSFRHEQGDSSLMPERGWQIDLAAQYRTSRWQLKFSPYFNYFSNYIYLRPTGQFTFLPEGGQIFRYEQGEVLHTGTEIQLEYHLLENLHLGLVGEYVWMLNMSTWVPLPWTPPASLIWEVEYQFKKGPKWLKLPYVGLDWRWVAAQNRVDRNEAPTPAYQLLQLQAGGNFKLGKQQLQARLMANNLLNARYFNHLSRYRLINLPEPRRNLQAVLSWYF
ncbi:MAG: TonB-dependent receptor [Bacteroidia bacterium]